MATCTCYTVIFENKYPLLIQCTNCKKTPTSLWKNPTKYFLENPKMAGNFGKYIVVYFILWLLVQEFNIKLDNYIKHGDIIFLVITFVGIAISAVWVLICNKIEEKKW